eukprot:COSAG02_NODE_697_length_18379_cov_37.948687_7_plen_175_part_00
MRLPQLAQEVGWHIQIPHTRGVGTPARHETVPGRATDLLLHVGAQEDRCRAGELVNVGRLHPGVAVRRHQLRAQVVGDHQQYILDARWRRRRRRRRRVRAGLAADASRGGDGAGIGRLQVAAAGFCVGAATLRAESKKLACGVCLAPGAAFRCRRGRSARVEVVASVVHVVAYV